MANVRTLKLNLLGDVSDFKKGLNKAESETKSFSGSLKSSMKTVAKSAALAGVAVAGMAVAFGVDAVKAAIADEKSQKKLATSLKNTTKATDKQVASAEKWITAQQFAYGVADDKLRPALAKLTGVTKDVSKAQDLLSLGLDISAGSGKDLESVTNILTRAQQGNLTGLKKLGVPLSDATIKNKDLATALEQTAAQFKGAAAANAGTFAGKLEIFNARIGEAKETIGTAILEAIKPFVEKWLPKISTLVTEVSDGFAGKGGNGSGVALGESIRTVATAIGAFISAVAGGAANGEVKTFADSVQSIANAFNNIANALDKLTTAYGKLSTFLNTTAGKALLESLPVIGAATNVTDYLTSNNSGPLQANKTVNGTFYQWDDYTKRWFSKDISGKPDYNIDASTKNKLGTPHRALGGSVTGGKSYYVGEHGPELFTPMGGSGTITPNSRLGGGTTIINLNGIIDAESARRAIERVLQQSSIRTGAVNIQGSLI